MARLRTAIALVPFGWLLARMFRGWFPVRVAGDSMAPTLQRGDLLAVRPLRRGEPREGQIVVARTPEREVVKRVIRVDGESVWLEGDNQAASTDSRTHGAFALADVAGVVRARYAPLARSRLF